MRQKENDFNFKWRIGKLSRGETRSKLRRYFYDNVPSFRFIGLEGNQPRYIYHVQCEAHRLIY